MRFAIVIAVVVAAIAASHVYIWVRLVRDLFSSPRIRRAGGALLAVLTLVTPLAVLRPPFLGGSLRRAIFAVGFPWVGFSLFLVSGLLVAELVRAGAWAVRAVRRDAPLDSARRRALGQVLGGAAVAAGGATALAGAAEVLHLVVERVRVPLARLPASMSGTRIVQISDVHLGAAVGPEYLARVIAAANALQPDLVAITGDLVDGSVDRLRAQVALLRDLRARYGVFFVTGNHEYYSNAVAWVAELASLGIRVLRNERVSIGAGHDGGSFDLAGVDDWSAARFGHGHGHDLPKALAGRDPTRELVLLAHQPASVHEAALHDVGLQLSGHTHGGQLFPLRLFLWFDQPFIDGLHRLGGTWIYVNRGAGYWGPPMRVGATPEITEVTLVRA
jgi:predicted MPP superfamily phosphohydrolase